MHCCTCRLAALHALTGTHWPSDAVSSAPLPHAVVLAVFAPGCVPIYDRWLRPSWPCLAPPY